MTRIGALHGPITWYKITHAGEQVAQWDFQNNATRTSQPGPAFVLEVPLHNLLTSMYDFVPCDRIVQRAYCLSYFATISLSSSGVLLLVYMRTNTRIILKYITRPHEKKRKKNAVLFVVKTCLFPHQEFLQNNEVFEYTEQVMQYERQKGEAELRKKKKKLN